MSKISKVGRLEHLLQPWVRADALTYPLGYSTLSPELKRK